LAHARRSPLTRTNSPYHAFNRFTLGGVVRGPHTFYLDPPYWQTEGYGVPFPFEEYEAMAARLRAIKGKAIVSLNDHPDVRRAFDGFHIETVDICYTVGGGRGAERKEVIIFSWDDAAQPAGLF
jgi:DNA adenine methylase